VPLAAAQRRSGTESSIPILRVSASPRLCEKSIPRFLYPLPAAPPRRCEKHLDAASCSLSAVCDVLKSHLAEHAEIAEVREDMPTDRAPTKAHHPRWLRFSRSGAAGRFQFLTPRLCVLREKYLSALLKIYCARCAAARDMIRANAGAFGRRTLRRAQG
jgi:hypothetical protein